MTTRWGTLRLVENPQEPKTPGFAGPVEKKVPRTIHLRGRVRCWIELPGDRSRTSAVGSGRGARSPKSHHGPLLGNGDSNVGSEFAHAEIRQGNAGTAPLPANAGP